MSIVELLELLFKTAICRLRGRHKLKKYPKPLWPACPKCGWIKLDD